MALYSQLAMAYHWTPMDIDEMDLVEVLTIIAVGYKLQQHYNENTDTGGAGRSQNRLIYADNL